MDLDLETVCSLVREGPDALQAARKRGLRPELLSGLPKAVYEFVIGYYSSYGSLPPLEVVAGKTGLEIDPEPKVKVPADFLVGEIFNRALHEKLIEGFKKFEAMIKDPIESKEPKKALAFLEEFILKMRKEDLATVRVESVWSLGPAVKKEYEEIKAGKRGILTPWPTINDATLGFWPMDLILFAARLGIGKTWTAIMLAYYAWEQKKRVLFATTEMSKERIGWRLFALRHKLPYKMFRSGMLTMTHEQKFFEDVDQMSGYDNFFVVGGNFDFRVESLSAAIDEVRPEFVVLDGAYLLKTSGKDRSERAAEAFNELKRLCTRHELPMAVTHQLNREAKGNATDTIRSENIGLTDVAGWNADAVFGLGQTDQMKRDKKIIIKPLKVREGVGDEIEVNWDLDEMNFTEIGKVNQGEADDSGVQIKDAGPEDVPF